MTVPALTAARLVERLDRALDERPALLAFDADGTLWSGDVAEDVFGVAVRDGMLLPAAREQLAQRARLTGLSDAGDSNALAGRLFGAYLEGAFPERDVCEVMAWCFAGWELAALEAWADDVLSRVDLEGRLRPSLMPVLEFARSRGVATLVVSASPGPIVRVAARRLDFVAEEVTGAEPEVQSGVLEPRLVGAVPYGADKRRLGLERIGPRRWLGSFGDSPFDHELLMAAELAVAVAPKPGLLELLAAHPDPVVLVP